MAFYRVCDKCGCSLDPGERCDCEQEVRRTEESMKKILLTDKYGQMTFDFTKEALLYEKAAV